MRLTYLIAVIATTVLAVAAAELALPAPHSSGAETSVQVRTGSVSDHPSWKYWDIVPDLSQTRLAVGLAKGGAMLEALVPNGAIAALNGGYFQRDFRPTGLVIDAGRELNRKNPVAKGGIVAVSGRKVYIGPLRSVPFKPDFAVQNGPMLINQNGSIAIRSDDGRRAARTVACLTGTGNSAQLHLIVIQAPLLAGPTLLETAQLLQAKTAAGGFGCQVALNLDGGSSTGVWFGPDIGLPSAPPVVPIGYAVAVVPLRSAGKAPAGTK